jgi:hypothetical protein
LPEIEDSYAAFRDRLDALGLEPVLIGALAAQRYRLAPRSTTDVDFLVRRLGSLVEVMQGDGYDVHVMAEPGEEPYVVFISGEGVKVDVLVAETDYQREALDRAVDGVLSVEDVLIHKLLAWRARDRDDVASILATGRPVDEAYVDRWVAAWGVEEHWDEARGIR